MRGWKPVEREIKCAVTLEEVKCLLGEEGFEIRVENPGHLVFDRSGTQLTVSGQKVPLELAVATTDEGLFLQLRYDTFVLFDTGDLDRLADELAAKLSA